MSTTIQPAYPNNGKSLKENLQTPALREQRRELEARLKSTPVNTLPFRQLKEELFQLNQRIQKAQAQDDLVWWQAVCNLGGLH